MSLPTPRLLHIRSLSDLLQYAKALLTDPRYFSTLACLVVLGDAVLTELIIRFVPCTSIPIPLEGRAKLKLPLQTQK